MLAACTPTGERTQLSVGYYGISGRSFEELDHQISQHGPSVAGAGRALAATNVRMMPDFRFAQNPEGCRVTKATVLVKAHVTLPRLASSSELRQGLSHAWSNLEEYARLHEAVHVSIADRYALLAEERVLALPPESDCAGMRTSAMNDFKQLMVEHQREQLQFDEDEKLRIHSLVNRTREGASLQAAVE